MRHPQPVFAWQQDSGADSSNDMLCVQVPHLWVDEAMHMGVGDGSPDAEADAAAGEDSCVLWQMP